MDLGIIIGILLGLGLIIGSIIFSGAPLFIYVDPSSVLAVFGGTIGSLLVGHPLTRVLSLPSLIGVALKVPVFEKEKVIRELVTFSEAARKEGLLSLDDKLDDVEDEFLKMGMRLVVDGSDPEVIKKILYNDLNQIQARHGSVIRLFDDFGKMAPAFGMIGTVQGLVAMMQNLSDKAAIGKGMALALLTTFYGAIVSNLIFVPLKNKLSERDEEEAHMKEIIIEGVLSIHNGENPRMLEQKLFTFVSPTQRKALQQEVSEGV